MAVRRRGASPKPAHDSDSRRPSGCISESAGDTDSDCAGGVSPVASPTAGGATKALTPEQTKAAESKLSKLRTRLMFGTPMIFAFFGLVWLGHPYMVMLVCLLQIGLFRELVNVRYKPAKERHVPMFRTVQWAMFFVAMCHVYGRVFVKLGLAHSAVERLPGPVASFVRETIKYHRLISFTAYVATFISFVLSLRPGLYRYQIGNTVWTVGVLSLVVWQIKGTTELIFAGLVWFMLPCGLVVANDCWAYFAGVLMGKRFIKTQFLALSPNKTWEGFIGGFFLTVIWGVWYAGVISEYQWLVCPQRNVDPFASLSCEPGSLFERQPIAIPHKDFALFVVNLKPFQLHSVLLAVFASVVAPFGGFLASAIKRAYNIKDFDSLIPGHGGFMDRMDCQFLMLLCTNVWYRTFVRAYDDLSEEDLLRVIRLMVPSARAHFLDQLLTEFNCTGVCSG